MCVKCCQCLFFELIPRIKTSRLQSWSEVDFFSDHDEPAFEDLHCLSGCGGLKRGNVDQLPCTLLQYLQCKPAGWQRSVFLFILALGLSAEIGAVMRNIFVGGLMCLWLFYKAGRVKCIVGVCESVVCSCPFALWLTKNPPPVHLSSSPWKECVLMAGVRQK